MTQKLSEYAWNAAFVAGSACVVLGVALISRPSAWIVAGLEIAVVSFLGGIDQARTRMHKEDPWR